MFPWDFARSAEAMFSSWAIKRVCKFLLKKKLGELILGDIDLDQLEVQIIRGTIQLSDLALNVDYINQKLSGSAVVLREGSIASLSIKIPWRLQNCQIELDELELVLAPFTGSKNHAPNSCSMPSTADKQHMNFGPDKIEPGTGRDTRGSVSLDIHEGVKTIAKIVKWLLTSFHVRLKNLIIAFDPFLEVNENRLPVNKSLVLRIAETEFGTFLSEDIDKVNIPKSECLLGTAKLTNFVKFEGAMIEVLTMTDIDKNSCPQDSLETVCNECSLSNLPLGSTTPILTGKSAGISGRMNLTIPWKNGSLDIHKIDAAVSFDPIELRLQPSTIEWIIFVSESIKHADRAARSVHSNMIDSSCSSSRLHNHSSSRNSSILAADITRPSVKRMSEDLHSNINCETFSEDLLPRMHVIQDWVPLSIKEDQLDLDQDIDQFFECFDEWRSSNATSGTNGLWGWTCSVFGAISVASNVASGSGHMLIEHVETSLRVTVAGFSLLLYFHDEEETVSDQLLCSDQDVNESCQLDHLSPLTDSTQNSVLNRQSFDSFMSCFSSVNVDHSTVGEPNITSVVKIHHLDVKCQDVVFNFQIGSLKKDIQISIQHAKIDEYYNHKNNFRMIGFSHSGASCDQILRNKSMRQKVLAAFAPFPFHVQDQEYDQETSVEIKVEKFNEIFSSQGRLIKVGLMDSFGDCSFHCTVSLADSDGSSVSSTSFSVFLPHCVLWVNFHLADSLLNLFKKVEIYLKRSRENLDLLFDDFSCGKKLASSNDVEIAGSSVKTVPTGGDYLQGTVVFARTRIVICFPSQITEDFGHLYPMEKFIVLEHYPSPVVEKVSPVSYLLSKQLCAPNGSFCTPTVSLHFEVGTFDMYLTDSASEDAAVEQSTPLHLKNVTTIKVLSVTNRPADQFGISIVWQKCPVTSPSMESRVWSMMSTRDHRSRNKVTGKACKFSTVAAVEDFEELSSEIRQDLILSSGFLLQFKISSILLNLRWHDYIQLNYLMDIVMPVFSNRGSSNLSVFEEDQPLCNHDISQATIIMDCDILDLQISAEEVSDHTHYVGSWSFFRLVVQKFELMSISNIGGVSATNFLRLIHGEGQLWGSIFNGASSTSVTTHDVLLVSCMNSASRRGCGDGTNVLSYGSAGTTITYICNPELFRSYTSIFIRCGSIVAPEGRLDWISDLCSFFNPPSENESSGIDVIQGKPSSNSTTYEASFFFELVDVALIYEPVCKHPVSNGDNAYAGCGGTFEANEELSEQFVGCLLGASSVSLSSHDISNSTISDYNIQVQDLGLFICASSGLKSDNVSYDVSYLQKTGYAKVASGILLVAALKIHGSRWEIECSDSHVSVDTWHDTTHALFRLIAQLQQIYAPDMEDAFEHLQSRWNTVQQNYNTNGSNDGSVNSRSSSSFDAGKSLPKNDGNSQSIGLLDGIIENAFYTTRGSDNPVIPSMICQNNYNNDLNLNSNISLVEDVSSVKMSSNWSACNLGLKNFCSTSNSGLENSEIVPMHEGFLPQLIESNYFSEIIAPSLEAKGIPPVNDKRCKYDLPVRSDVDCRMGTWYKDGYLMLVDNHIPNSNILDSDQYDEESELVPVDSDASSNCCEKGKILIRNIDVRWRMFVGSGWSKQINSTGKEGLELMLSGMNIRYSVYPDGGINLSKLCIHVQDFYLYDTRTNAPWKMVIGHYNSKDHPRETDAKAFKLDLETVRPDPAKPLEDYRLFLECLPIRLHLDQSQINFLVTFFGDQSSVEDSPFMSKDVDNSCIFDEKNKACRSPAIVEEALLPFFQKCVVKPLVVRVDYIPRHMDLASLRNGNYIELLNLVPWKGIDLQLKHVCALGLYGWMSVCETVVGQWLEDISHNQVHKLLKGLPPIRSLVSVATGTSKLITLPVKSYKRDKKLLKGVQRGAIAFVKSVSLEAVGLGVHLASGAHDILLQTEYILTNIQPSIPSSSEKSRIRKCANSLQPEDAQEGLRQAYESLSNGLSRTASGLLGTPIKEYRRGAGAGSALATALRAAPAAVIAPVTASANAMRCALLGMRNSLDPEHMKESMDKYRGPSRP